ncbi:hypothetical protein [Limibacillus sp. MBR-115]|jgi:hypothetical protein|uniref:hypothetical protein n=1 Tax=Limibacillus sp. MBR-115 TaxID=3156465 RepID=UPI003397AD2A
MQKLSLGAFVALAFLAGCSNTGIFEDVQETRSFCPGLELVEGAQRIVEYKGSGRDLTDVSHLVVILDAQFSCLADDDEVSGDVQIQFEARRGPANDGVGAPFRYFVAVADSQRRILARQSFDVLVPFEGNRGRFVFNETIEPEIPLANEGDGAGYRIFIGLEVTREQYQENLSDIR